MFLSVPPGLTFKNSTWLSLCVECFLRIWEQRATFALYMINWLAFITVVESVYCAVRTDSLYTADYVSSLKGEYTISYTNFNILSKILQLNPWKIQET